MRKEYYSPSHDGRTQIHAMEWIPEGRVRGVLQIAHGMVEFIERYDGFASFMASHGFYVTGNDHLGHGRSVTEESDYGYFARRDGFFCVLEDMRQLCADARGKYPDLRCFLLGHSMGSFLARAYMEKYGEDLSGAIVMGTAWQPAPTLDLAIGLTAALQRIRGGHYRSPLINGMALGSYNAAFEPGRTKNDWLTRDEAIVDAYVANPLNQFVFTVNGYNSLFRAIRYSERRKNLARIPKDLPILVVSGGKDPVGNFGKGPRTVAEAFRTAGITDVTLKLYPDDRHELLNELDRDAVYQDLLTWLEARL